MKIKDLLKRGGMGLLPVMMLTAVSGCNGMKSGGTPTAQRYPELHQVFQRLDRGEPVTTAYLGGSITWGATSTDPLRFSWRALTAAWLQDKYPQSRIKAIDAAIGGKGSELAVFRMDRDVTPFRPDLTFVEFAVNDAGNTDGLESMEGIVRKLHSANPKMAIVIVVIGSGAKNYGTPREKEYCHLAEYYGLPVINICHEIQGKLDTGLKTAGILTDGCHPNDRGYRMYADIVERELTKQAEATGTPTPYPAKPLTANRFESARMIELSKLKELSGWKVQVPDVTGIWFDHQPSRWLASVIVPDQAGAKLELPLSCDGLGLYFETVPGGGIASLLADGEKFLTVDTAFKLHYPGLGYKFKFLSKAGEHRVTLTADSAKPLKIGYLLVTGK